MTNQPLTQDEPHNRFIFDSDARAALTGLAPGETFRFDSGFVAERLPDEGFSMSFDSNGELTLVALLNPDLTMRINGIRELKPAPRPRLRTGWNPLVTTPTRFPGPVRGPGSGSSDSIPAWLSPGESFLPSPTPGNIIHIREAYGDQPMEISEVDVDDLEDDA